MEGLQQCQECSNQNKHLFLFSLSTTQDTEPLRCVHVCVYVHVCVNCVHPWHFVTSKLCQLLPCTTPREATRWSATHVLQRVDTSVTPNINTLTYRTINSNSHTPYHIPSKLGSDINTVACLQCDRPKLFTDTHNGVQSQIEFRRLTQIAHWYGDSTLSNRVFDTYFYGNKM